MKWKSITGEMSGSLSPADVRRSLSPSPVNLSPRSDRSPRRDSPQRSRSVTPVQCRYTSACSTKLQARELSSDLSAVLDICRSPVKERISLYVSGLAARVTDEELYDHFKEEGKVLLLPHAVLPQYHKFQVFTISAASCLLYRLRSQG